MNTVVFKLGEYTYFDPLSVAMGMDCLRDVLYS